MSRLHVLFAMAACCFVTVPARALDTNVNGMSDVWEMLHNQLELFPESQPEFAPGADPDGDGQTNLQESVVGTDPFSGVPPLGIFHLQIRQLAWPPDTFRLTLPLSVSGKTYAFSTSPDLSPGSWTTIDPMAGTGENLVLNVQPADESTGILSEKAFFRAQVQDQTNPGGLFSPWELGVLANHPDIEAALQPLLVPGGTPTGPGDPPPVPNSDNSGYNDSLDASPHDDKVDWLRTPEAKYLHIPVQGIPAGFEPVDISDSGKILFNRTIPVVDYTTDPVGFVWDPTVAEAQRFTPVMFSPAPFQLKVLQTTWSPVNGSSVVSLPMPMPVKSVPGVIPNPAVGLGVTMKAIADGGSLLADVNYIISEYLGTNEQPTLSGGAKLVFAWKGNAYGGCQMLGTDLGCSGVPGDLSYTENHTIGFHHNTALTPAVDEAVITHMTIRAQDSEAKVFLAVRNHNLGTPPLWVPWTGYADYIPGAFMNPMISRSGKVVIQSRTSDNDLQRVVCGKGVSPALPLDAYVDGLGDFPEGITPAWGIGLVNGAFRIRSGGAFEPVASLTGVLTFDRQGNGIGNGQDGRHIWRNARWHTLEEVTGLSSVAGMVPKKITSSGLIWAARQDGSAHSLLIPVEIVSPVLDGNEMELEYGLMGVEELKVAKMEHSLDAQGALNNDLDPHRFYIRIPASLGGVEVVAKLGTADNFDPSYNDPATDVPLTANSAFQQSQSQLLVSDESDDLAGDNDEQVGDRTHKVMLGGNVEIGAIRIGPNTYPFSMKVPVKIRKYVDITMILVGGASVYADDIYKFKKVAKERYAQVGVYLNFSDKMMPAPSLPFAEEQVQTEPGGESVGGGRFGFIPNSDVIKLVDKADQLGLRGGITMFVVTDISENAGGRSHSKANLGVSWKQYGDIAILSGRKMVNVPDPAGDDPKKRRWFTVGHELFHILAASAGHFSEYGVSSGRPEIRDDYGAAPGYKVQFNLMKEGTSMVNELGSTKRIFRMQELLLQQDLMTNP